MHDGRGKSESDGHCLHSLKKKFFLITFDRDGMTSVTFIRLHNDRIIKAL